MWQQKFPQLFKITLSLLILEKKGITPEQYNKANKQNSYF